MNSSDLKNRIYNEMFHNERTIVEAAVVIDCSIEDAEKAAFELCKEDKSLYKRFGIPTPEWLAEKKKSSTISEIGELTGLNYKQVQYLLSKYQIAPRKPLREQLTKEDLCRLYVDQELSDSEIAEMYQCSAHTIKRLRADYDIQRDDRKTLEEKCPLELFHRLYVTFGIGTDQIAKLIGVTRANIAKLRELYVGVDSPLASEIASKRNTGINCELFAELLDKVPHTLLIEGLKNKDIQEIAMEYGVIGKPNNRYTPFTKKWLETELLTKTIRQVASENGKSTAYISGLVKEMKVSIPEKAKQVDEEILRELYLRRYWSDAEIGKHFNLAPVTIKKIRLSYGIHSTERMDYKERLTPQVFMSLYLHEGLNLAQIASATRVPPNIVRKLKKEYAASGYEQLAGQRIIGVTAEKLEYISKQINLNIYTPFRVAAEVGI